MTALINADTSSGVVITSDTSGSLALQSAGTTKFTVASTGAYGQITSGTAVASTSGTSIDFTSIPSWVKRITVMFSGVSTSGTSNIQIQIGAGSVDTASYVSTASTNGTSLASSTTGFLVAATTAAATTVNGWYAICLLGSNAWTGGGSLGRADGNMNNAGGAKTLSGTLDRVRITTVNGTDTFDAGSVNILYEG
jgi:hypothetical protein